MRKSMIGGISPQESAHAMALDCAMRLFAEKGFHKTTIADICSAAKINIAAVNYYFRSKENLYQEVWRHAHHMLSTRFPMDGGVRASASAALRLEGRIRAMIQRSMAPDGYEFRIMEKEMANPTGLLNRIIEDTIAPLRHAMQRILKELLGGAANDRAIRFCEMSVVGPLMHVLHVQRRGLEQGGALAFAEQDLEPLVAHFTAFALAGIACVRRGGGRQTEHRRRSGAVFARKRGRP